MTSTTPPRTCSPCRRGACEDCHGADYDRGPGNPYTCCGAGGPRCPRPADGYGTNEIGGDHGVPALP